ncbi:NAD-dependent epimerase/dehydratase family protein [Acetobacterium carbinolicum]|uniref:NAD-dependent epimerase/dehydratase family protein n=1 Tax=Acetobacterium carbinolicum TaxID=52690 RepID=UPI0039BF12F9
MIKKAILTGATGYIGSSLLRELLKKKWRVIIVVRKTSSFHYIQDIKNEVEIFEFDNDLNKMVDLFDEIKPDVVFHLASKVIVQHDINDIPDIINSNVLFATQILEAMTRTNTANIVNTGTSWQHFGNEQYNPVNLYAASKEAFFSILKYYNEAFGVHSITLELFDTYGPNDKRPKVLNLIKDIDKNSASLEMTPGEQEVNLVFINDVVRAYIIAAEILISDNERHVNKSFSICAKETVTLKELVILYEMVNKTELDIKWGAKSYRNREVMSIWNKGEILPGWNAEIKLEEGLHLFCECEQGGKHK